MPISSGIYGLAGVVIGGIVTGGVQWGIAGRADWLDTRVARRRVKAELTEISGVVGYIDNDPEARVSTHADTLCRADMLKAHGDRLARHLSEEAWEAVNLAYVETAWLLKARPELVPWAAKRAREAVNAAIKCLT